MHWQIQYLGLWLSYDSIENIGQPDMALPGRHATYGDMVQASDKWLPAGTQNAIPPALRPIPYLHVHVASIS